MPLDMGGCAPPSDTALACPVDEAAVLAALIKHFPRGWAWDALEDPDAIMHKRAKVVSAMLADFLSDACALLAEFNCNTMSATAASWEADYGIPDDCGINDLCTKVTAIGDGTCQSLVDLGHNLGNYRRQADLDMPAEYVNMDVDVCCEELPIEIQCGCWDGLGFDQMPPQWVYEKGGSELGFVPLGYCPPLPCGSDLGQDVHNETGEDCNISGYQECEDTSATLAPCSPAATCHEYERSYSGTLLTGCAAPYELNYVGTAYTLKLGIAATSPLLTDNRYTQMGCFEMGCDQLCGPPIDAIKCFLDTHKHAHVRSVFFYC